MSGSGRSRAGLRGDFRAGYAGTAQSSLRIGAECPVLMQKPWVLTGSPQAAPGDHWSAVMGDNRMYESATLQFTRRCEISTRKRRKVGMIKVKVQAESGELRKNGQHDGREKEGQGLVQPTEVGLCKIKDTGMTTYLAIEMQFNLFIVLGDKTQDFACVLSKGCALRQTPALEWFTTLITGILVRWSGQKPEWRELKTKCWPPVKMSDEPQVKNQDDH